MMAFETRYDVSTHVDSSWPTDKFPAMCGSATFAIEVSRTSIKVASVTVRAITQGLIVPSGFLSLARILFFIARSRPQHSLLRRNRVQHYLYRDALHDFHEISGGVFRRKQAQH